MKYLAIACVTLMLSGCPAPEKQPRQLVSCVTPSGQEVRTGTYDFWEYEGGGWRGYSYEGTAAVMARVVAVYVPVQGSVCSVQEVR